MKSIFELMKQSSAFDYDLDNSFGLISINCIVFNSAKPLRCSILCFVCALISAEHDCNTFVPLHPLSGLPWSDTPTFLSVPASKVCQQFVPGEL